MSAAPPKRRSWLARGMLFIVPVLVGGILTWIGLPPNLLKSYAQPLMARWGYEWSVWTGQGIRLGVAVAAGLVVWFLSWLLVVSIKRTRSEPEPEPDESTRFLQALHSPNPTERHQAATKLGDEGDERAVDQLLQRLDESTGPERRALAEALFKIGRALTAAVTQARRR